MNGVPQLLIPAYQVSIRKTILIPKYVQDLPFRRLPAALVRLRLLRLFAQTCSTVRTLLPHRAPVGQVLPAVYNQHQRANLWTIHRHVREDASRVHSHPMWPRGAGQLGRHSEQDQLYYYYGVRRQWWWKIQVQGSVALGGYVAAWTTCTTLAPVLTMVERRMDTA